MLSRSHDPSRQTDYSHIDYWQSLFRKEEVFESIRNKPSELFEMDESGKLIAIIGDEVSSNLDFYSRCTHELLEIRIE